MSGVKRIGLVGYGFIGAELCRIVRDGAYPELSIAFVWNRSRGRLSGLPSELRLDDLARFAQCGADVIVEGAHPAISAESALHFCKPPITCRYR